MNGETFLKDKVLPIGMMVLAIVAIWWKNCRRLPEARAPMSSLLLLLMLLL